MVDEPEAESLFYNASLAQVVAGGFHLGDGADHRLREYARKTAAEIWTSSSEPLERDRKVTEAVLAFRRVAETMIEVRDEAYRTQPERLAGTVVGEDTLGMAFRKLCPGLWPFC